MICTSVNFQIVDKLQRLAVPKTIQWLGNFKSHMSISIAPWLTSKFKSLIH